MTMKKYINRYGDEFTFELNERGNIQWSGDFKHCRYAWPNVYKDAYQAYRKDGGTMHIDEFKKAVHKYDNEKSEYTPLAKQYGKLVYSDTKSICMVDPSGGPYISSEMDMGDFGFDGKIVNGFISNKDGYEIIVEK